MDFSKYMHSPAHKAVINRDYVALRQMIDSFPRLSDPSEIRDEAHSLEEEAKADAISAILDRRDVPNRETPLHLAVKIADVTSAEILVSAGADHSLQNAQGWSALQEAICHGEDAIARAIVRHYHPCAWAKWCRRLPRLVATMTRMRDFYMEITFHFDSSVVPFVSRIAPSDTYRIWKQGSNLRADMTLAGFDGFKIQRADQTVLFFGTGSEDGKLPTGSLLMISHKNREIMNALDGTKNPVSEVEIDQEVRAMFKTSMFRPGIDVTRSVLLPQLTWRKHEKVENVGSWKAKVYDMHHVVVSVKSRPVPGAMTDEELFNSGEGNGDGNLDSALTVEERRQLEDALKQGYSDDGGDDDNVGNGDGTSRQCNNCSRKKDSSMVDDTHDCCNNGDGKHGRKGLLGIWGKKTSHSKQDHQLEKMAPPRSSLCVDSKVSNLLGDSPPRDGIRAGRHSIDGSVSREGLHKAKKEKDGKKVEHGHRQREVNRESEYRKGLRPILWLSSDFPLQVEELLPLLDILASKVKAVRRLRELLTTKLPHGTFPVKVAIPVIPSIRVLVTFTKFEELHPVEEFTTPPSSPEHSSPKSHASSSWLHWMKAPYRQHHATSTKNESHSDELADDAFAIPADYKWVTVEEKRKKQRQQQEKNSKKGKARNK